MSWISPTIQLEWGPYFRADPEEQKKIVDMVTSTMDTGLIPRRELAAKLAPVFNISNIDAALATADKEAADREAKFREATKAAGKAVDKLEPVDSDEPQPNEEQQ